MKTRSCGKKAGICIEFFKQVGQRDMWSLVHTLCESSIDSKRCVRACVCLLEARGSLSIEEKINQKFVYICVCVHDGTDAGNVSLFFYC